MAEEQTSGPALLTGRPAKGSDEEEEEEADEQSQNVLNERLRRYELDRLRYYFGVVVCDSTETAEHLYNECDGAEFEASSLPLDLRFIPEDMRTHS